MVETHDGTGDVAGNAPSERRKPRRPLTWLWVLFAFVAGLILPALACFGVLFVVGATAGTTGDASLGDIGFGPGVGVIRVEGVIVPGESVDAFNESAGSGTIVRLIQQADADPDVKALLLRVDSPGGGVVASDEIHHALTQIEKPIVVSMGTLAASGGYYVSAPADYIFANPHTLTGSIGVISSFINGDELLEEVGVDVVVLTTGDFKDTGSFYRDMSAEERDYWQAIIDESYDGFVGIVAQGRDLSDADVRELADGRVYTGRQALELGLVDELGYFEDAAAKAAELGGIEGDARLIEFEPAPGFFDYLASAQAGPGLLPDVLDILELMAQPTLEYRYIGP